MKRFAFFTLSLLALLGTQLLQAQQITLYSQPQKVESLIMFKSNEVFIKLPADVDWNTITFKSTNAKISKQSTTGYISISPQSEDVSIEVYNGDQLHGTINFEAYRPYIHARSATVMALYLNCGNEIFIDPKGYDINPMKMHFKAEGASLIEGKQKGYVTVVPDGTQTEVAIHVFEGEQKLGSMNFKVRRVPIPEVVVMHNNQGIDLKKGIRSKSSINTLDIRVMPDENFKQFLPKDARYSVNDYIITLAQGMRAVQTIKGKGSKASITSLMKKAEPGDRLIVEVKGISRMNFNNEVEQVKNTGSIYVIPLN